MAFPIESGLHLSLDGTTWYKLTDHNRGEIEITPELIEKSARMANGTLRKYVVSKKMRISTSWERVPSDSTYTVDQNKSAEWLEAFYNANVGLPIKLKVISATGAIPSPGTAPVDGLPVESKIYDVFISDFSKTIVWRTNFAEQSAFPDNFVSAGTPEDEGVIESAGTYATIQWQAIWDGGEVKYVPVLVKRRRDFVNMNIEFTEI